MSPTIFVHGAYRFFFFSREETRIHVHVTSPDGEAKFWLEPAIELAQNHGLDKRRLRLIEALIRNHEEQIRLAWIEHFSG